MRLYTTKEEVLNYVLLDVSEGFESQIDKWIEQMSKYVETKTQRVFETESSDVFEERLYDGNAKQKLLVDDFIELDKVDIVDHADDIDVKLYPANSLPKFQIYYEKGFPKRNQNVKVSAKWGYSEEPPEDIRFATTVLVAGIILGQSKTENAIVREKIGNYEVQYRNEKELQDFNIAKSTLSFYRKISI